MATGPDEAEIEGFAVTSRMTSVSDRQARFKRPAEGHELDLDPDREPLRAPSRHRGPSTRNR